MKNCPRVECRRVSISMGAIYKAAYGTLSRRASDAQARVSKMFSISSCTVKRWAAAWEDTGEEALIDHRGFHEGKDNSILFLSPALVTELKLWVQKRIKKGKDGYVTIMQIQQYINDVLLTDTDIVSPEVLDMHEAYYHSRQVSRMTVLRWMHKLGFNWADSSNAPFCDRHEHPDIVAYRNEWVRQMLTLNPRLPVLNEVTGKPEWPNLPPGEKPLFHGNHDESILYANEGNRFAWVSNDAYHMKPKGDGTTIMVHQVLVKLFQGACNFAAFLKDITGIVLQFSTANSKEPVKVPDSKHHSRCSLPYSKDDTWYKALPTISTMMHGKHCRCRKVKDTSLNRTGSVEGQKVKNILLDTGCSRTMVKKRWVPQERMLEGKMVSVRCAQGDTELYPLADIRMKVDGTPIRVEAAVADTLPVDVLLGTDVKQLSNLLGRSVPRKITDKVAGGDGMVVVTRARARQELEEIFRRGKEVQSGVRSKVLNEDSPRDDALASAAFITIALFLFDNFIISFVHHSILSIKLFFIDHTL
ncbi:hypothetical protein EMCRGX_G023152 [Ephydatia muelleri]